jgi:hypothetical protein
VKRRKRRNGFRQSGADWETAAACVKMETESPVLIPTLVGQRIFAIAVGYEDLNDHAELRHDPMMAVLAGKLTAEREEYAPVAGK